MIDYAKLAILGGLVAIVFGSGWYLGNSRYVNYKKEVEATAKLQEEKIKSIRSQQELVTKGIENEYEAKLSALKSYYGGLRQPSSGKLPSISNPASGVNESATDQLLACAYTTQQLVSLQEWTKQQMGIK